MKTTIYCIIIIIWLIYLSEPTILFKPFLIKFEKPYTPFAYLFLIISIILLNLQSYNDGYKKGIDNTFNSIIKYIKENKK